MCQEYGWDIFEQKLRPDSQWMYFYMHLRMTSFDELRNEKLPLAELIGELSGGLANPDALKEYKKNKKQQEEMKKSGKSVHMSKDGGMAQANTTLRNGQIVNDETGEVVMTDKDLEDMLNSMQF